MKKYIVEAPEPKKGQTISSGGIRENGKMAAQFRNPIPYEEPVTSPMISHRVKSNGEMQETHLQPGRNEVGMHILGLVWQECAEPLVRSSLRKMSQTIVARIENSSTRSADKIPSKASNTIDVEFEETGPMYDDDKIIQFPSQKVV